jgi:hypothetical protein
MIAFNGDHLIWNEFSSLISHFDVGVIIETGTYKAQSTIDFAEFGLPVHTTESKTEYYNESVAAIYAAGVEDVVVPHFGDSPTILETLLPPLEDKRIIFFLDAHWYKDNCLERELQILSNITFKKPPVILIHDVKVPDHPEYGHDIYNGKPVSFAWIQKYINQIYGVDMYKAYYNTGVSDQASHCRGCLFVAPNQPIQS